MRATSQIEVLEERIEQVVREHIAAVRAGVEAAVARAFAESTGRLPQAAAPKARTPTQRPPNRRRTQEEVAAWADRLCAAVHTMPGETMTRLAPHVGATPQELSLPVEHLRRAGRVRTVGQRQHTRYFPTAKTPTRTS